MQPLSNDLRKRILDAVDNKEGSRRKLSPPASRSTHRPSPNCSGSGCETGSFEPRPHARWRHPHPR